jgi:uncharacterized protein YbjQ (UPF0145 family)
MSRTERIAMLSSTMNDLPGYRGTSVLGEVFGLTARSGTVGSQFGAAFDSRAGASASEWPTACSRAVGTW